MHIHPSSPNSADKSEENAATKIQAGFRGYRVRKQMKTPNTSVTTTAANGNGVIKHDYEEDTKNVEDIERSATKIQANVRGFLVRKKQKVATDAATKIQASFRGFKTRKDLEKTKVK
jgi:myosin heavy subunit